MLGVRDFYKTTPKIMPKVDLAAPSSPVVKKRRPAEGKATNGADACQPRRTSSRVAALRVKTEPEEEEESLGVVKEEDVKPALPSNRDSDSEEDSDDENGGLSSYERKRLRNIQENAKFFASLGISKTKDTLTGSATAKAQASSRGLKPEKKPWQKAVLPPRRQPSLRIRRIDPEGVALPDLPPALVPEPSHVHVRKPAGPMNMKPTNVSGNSEEILPGSLCRRIKHPASSPNRAGAETALEMTLAPERVAKVTKERIFSVAVHPTTEKIVACAGDKWGGVGVWDVDSQEGDDGVYFFQPHSRPVSCLQFAPANPAKLVSCSYDGTGRCGDFERGVFDEIYTTLEEDDVHCSYFDFLSPDGVSLLMGQNQQHGYVKVVDTRLRSSGLGYWVHDRFLKTVHIHPAMPTSFVTCCNDGTVALWDLRNMKERGRCESVSEVTHGRSVSSAFFSPITGSRILTTSYDDRIRILKVDEQGKLEVDRSIRHNNHTGRWLSTFKAAWHPQREDVFTVGSMDRPRQVHLFDVSGRLLHRLMDEDCLSSVCSITAWHPTRDIVVGGNSSGRLHVFM